MINDIIDFLPIYPEILNPEFGSEIYKKYEFYENKLETAENIKKVNYCTILSNSSIEKDEIEPGDYLRHQKIAARFMSSYTEYDRLLVVHQMGTGKTKLAIAICEKIKSENSTIKRALICAKGHNLLENFKRELVCETDGSYVPENFRLISSDKRIREENRLLRRFYDFYRDNISKKSSFGYTFYEIAKTLQDMSDDDILEQYSNYVIVVDEIHNIRDKDIKKQTSLQVYNQLYRLFHIAKNTKVVLMSGTPIRDRVEEISEILNLLLSEENKLPTGKKFMLEYFTEDDGFYTMKEDMIPIFKEKLKGRVSYLRAITSDVQKVLIGDKSQFGLHYFTVYPVIMGKFQSSNYIKYFNRDMGIPSDDEEQIESKANIWLASRQASLFVFPDGSIGEDGFSKYVKRREITQFSANKSSKTIRYFLSDDMSNILKGTETELLSIIEKFSTKYSSCIKNIIASYNSKKSQFVYCEYVRGGGCILLSLMLEKFGFSRANGQETSPGKRYALLTTETTSPSELRNIQRRFNSPDNMHGEYISVLIGSDVISEGFSFLNVQTEHVLTLFWNYAKIDQAIARGYRYGSHTDLKMAGENPTLEIYQYVSIPVVDGVQKPEKSINLKMAKVSEIKDVNNKKVERFIKESAFDCALNYDRNKVIGYDNERECEYQGCSYKCDYVDPDLYMNDVKLGNDQLDFSTYQLYYVDKRILELQKAIKRIFRREFKVHYDLLVEILIEKESNKFYTLFELSLALNNIIEENQVILNKYNIPCWLREKNNIYFLISNFIIENDIFCSFYSENLYSKKLTNYTEVISRIELSSTPRIIQTIFRLRDEGQINSLINKLSLNTQELLLENSKIADNLEIDKNEYQRKLILDIFKFYMHDSTVNPDTVVSTFSFRSQDKLRCFNKKSSTWIDCDDKETTAYKGTLSRNIDSTKYEGYYGLYNPKTNSFCINQETGQVESKASKKKTGVSCGTGAINKKELIRLNVKVFKTPIPEEQKGSSQKKIWNEQSKETLLKYILSNNYTKELFTKEEYQNFSKEELQRILFWTNFSVKSDTAPSVCNYLKEWLDSQNLLFVDYDCGTQFKKKK